MSGALPPWTFVLRLVSNSLCPVYLIVMPVHCSNCLTTTARGSCNSGSVIEVYIVTVLPLYLPYLPNGGAVAAHRDGLDLARRLLRRVGHTGGCCATDAVDRRRCHRPCRHRCCCMPRPCQRRADPPSRPQTASSTSSWESPLHTLQGATVSWPGNAFGTMTQDTLVLKRGRASVSNSLPNKNGPTREP